MYLENKTKQLEISREASKGARAKWFLTDPYRSCIFHAKQKQLFLKKFFFSFLCFLFFSRSPIRSADVLHLREWKTYLFLLLITQTLDHNCLLRSSFIHIFTETLIITDRWSKERKRAKDLLKEKVGRKGESIRSKRQAYVVRQGRQGKSILKLVSYSSYWNIRLRRRKARKFRFPRKETKNHLSKNIYSFFFPLLLLLKAVSEMFMLLIFNIFLFFYNSRITLY